MAFKLHSSVREISVTGGTGDQILTGAPFDQSYSRFADRYANADTGFYLMKQGTLREFGLFTRVAGVGIDKIARTLVFGGSNGTSLVNFVAGQTIDICVTEIAPSDLDAATRTLFASSMGVVGVDGAQAMTSPQQVQGRSNLGLGNIATKNLNETFSFAATTASTSSTNGAVTVAGGVGIAGALNVGGGFSVAGGGNISGNLNVAGTISRNASFGTSLSLGTSGIQYSGIGDYGTGPAVFSNSAVTTGMFIPTGASAWAALSDERLPWKKGARKISALDRLDHFQLYENEVGGRLEAFVMAQEFYKVAPHLVTVGSADPDYVPQGLGDKKAWNVFYDRSGIFALQAVKDLRDYVRQQLAK